jgi:sulfoxide reductase heme-binding subunit YedZ
VDLQAAIFMAAIGPFVMLVWAGATSNLGADPLAGITNTTDEWALRFLCLTLAVTPFRWLTRWNGAIRFRRILGLFASFTARCIC